MGRAMKPVRVYREAVGGEMFVVGVSGYMVRDGLWSDATREAANVFVGTHGTTEDCTDGWSGDQPFDVRVGLSLTKDDKSKSFTEMLKEEMGSEGDDDQEDDNDGEQDMDLKDLKGKRQSDSETIDDIVRRIAGDLDDTQGKLISATLDQRLADFQPKGGGSGDIQSIIAKIQIETKTGDPIELDGIFHNQFPKLLMAVQSGQHTFLPGPPGTGKSHAAEQVATALGYRFASISLGPTTPESRLWGGMGAHGKFFEPPFVTLARHAQEVGSDGGSVYCLDEMDNGHPGILATLNSAMANGWFTAPNGDVITVGRNFVVVGAANTYGTGPTAEFSGRNRLDAATLDRFVYLPWDTDTAMENILCRAILPADEASAWLDVWTTCRANVDKNGLKVFVSMRGCLNGARLIASGFWATDALDMVLLNKLPADQARKVWSGL